MKMKFFLCLFISLIVLCKGENKIAVSLLLDSSVRFNELWFNENFDGPHFQYLKDFVKNFVDTFGITANRRVDVIQFRDAVTSETISCNSSFNLESFKAKVNSLTNYYEALSNIDLVSGINEGKKKLQSNLCGSNESFATAMVVLTSGIQVGSNVDNLLTSFYLQADAPKTYVVYLKETGSPATNQYNILTKNIVERQFPVTQFIDFQNSFLASSVANQVIAGSFEPFDVTAWSVFGQCSNKCQQTRTRVCTGQCAGVETSQSQNCTTGLCSPIFGTWSSFSICSASCLQTRNRTCTGNCQNATVTETQSCLGGSCPNVIYGAWSSFSLCSASCLQTRNRTCTGNCENATITETQSCLGNSCPNVIYGAWSSFSLCSASCLQTRNRTCTGNCENATITETQSCSGDFCLNVIYGAWSSFSLCSASCLQTRNRTCTGNCQNATVTETQSCLGDSCPNVIYGAWSSFSLCSASCLQTRNRTCTGNCENATVTETQSCLGDSCPNVIYGAWSSFSLCSASCLQTRNRTCTGNCQNATITETQSCSGDFCLNGQTKIAVSLLLDSSVSFNELWFNQDEPRFQYLKDFAKNFVDTFGISANRRVDVIQFRDEFISEIISCNSSSTLESFKAKVNDLTNYYEALSIIDLVSGINEGKKKLQSNLCGSNESFATAMVVLTSGTQLGSNVDDLLTSFYLQADAPKTYVVYLNETGSPATNQYNILTKNIVERQFPVTQFIDFQKPLLASSVANQVIADSLEVFIVSTWSVFGQCSIKCQQERTRVCTGQCAGVETSQTQNCTTDLCLPIFGSWTLFSSCSVSCLQTRSRTCTGNCQNATTVETQSCLGDFCPNAIFGEWSTFSNCSMLCQQSRTRTCTGNCQNATVTEIQSCLGGSCSNVSFGEWSTFGACSALCQQTRTRSCDGNCQNSVTSESQACLGGSCPNVIYSGWSVFSECSTACTKTRTRNCTGNCLNAVITETQNCSGGQCPPVETQMLTQWSPFSDCSATCNQDSPIRTRSRTCTPAALCQGVELINTTPCNREFACPEYRLGDWGAWSPCSASCRISQVNPMRARARDYCLSNSSSLYQCTDSFMINYEPCNTAACPIVKSCSNLNITFVIVLDSSSSVTDLSWSQEKGFATSFIANSELGVNPNVQVAVVNFASYAVVSSPCGTLTNKSDFINFMTALPRINGGTAINDGLLKARDAYRGCQRLNVSPVVLFLTDGYENIEPSYTYRVQTEDLVKSEALLFVGAIGSDVNPTDINRMSHYVVNGSDVYYNRFAKNFSELASIKAEEFYPLVLGKLQCEGKGLWTEWGAWSSCSFTCGATGFQRRERLCQNPTTLNIQEDCDSDGNIAKYELRICSAQCRAFSEWTNWASCSASCRPESGPPTTSRSRTCGIGLGSCVGLYSETQECNTNTQCPGDLTEWSAFSACSQSCQIGSIPPTTKRVRKCINTSLGGNCNGQPLEEIKVCNFETPCPGQLTEWTLWSSCPATCQPAVNVYLKQYRSRECQNTSFFANCSGEKLVDETVCVKDVPCPGILKEWSSWSLCTASCRNDILTIPTRTRTRLCDAATLNGNCGGVPLVTNEACNENVGCPGTWTNWGPFTECSESCQSNAVVVPTRSRQRFCVNNTLNGTCPSEDGLGKLQTLECNAGVICPIRGTWNTWGAWSECSASCDAGITQRARNCSTPWPSDAGDDCVGDIVQKAPCKLFDCPRVCMTPKRCSCSQATQWNYVPTFDQFQNEGITLEVIDEVMSYLMIYDEETVNQTCEVCDKMILDSMKSQLTNHMMQVNLTLVKLKAIKENLRDVINCNQMLQNYSGLWELYDLIFERGVMLDGILIEMQAIYIRFEAASTSCESYGWFHQVVSSILRKTN